MQLIIQWITQIIIFLLLANIIELLIPKTTMKKYIKLVVGLILLLVFLKPLFHLFTIDIKNEVERVIRFDSQSETESKTIEDLTEIEIKEIQASQDAYILEQLTAQLKELAKTVLIDEFSVAIDEINYQFTSSDNISYEDLSELVVTIHKTDRLGGAVRSVDEISILDNEQNIDDEMITQAELEKIEETLREVWELGDVQLIIISKGGAS